MRYNSSSLCGHGLSVSMNPLVWVLKWCNPNHTALKITVLAGSTDRMLMMAMNYNTSDWAPSDSLNVFVNTFWCVHTAAGGRWEKRFLFDIIIIDRKQWAFWSRVPATEGKSTITGGSLCTQRGNFNGAYMDLALRLPHWLCFVHLLLEKKCTRSCFYCSAKTGCVWVTFPRAHIHTPT